MIPSTGNTPLAARPPVVTHKMLPPGCISGTTRTRPNNGVGPTTGKRYILDQAFADRVNDSRYANTFQSVWISNTAVTNTSATAGNTRGITYTTTPGVDTAVWIPDFEVAGAPQFNGATPF